MGGQDGLVLSSRPLRLDRILASLGHGTRTTVQPLLRAGRVAVDGTPVKNGALKTFPGSITIDGAALDHPEGILIMLHKPVGFVCSHNPAEAPLVYELLPERWLARKPVPTTVGRLDRDTSGLILITDDMPLIHRLTSPRHAVAKVYEVTVAEELDERLIPLFASGEYLLKGEEKPCLPAELEILTAHRARLVLHEGRFHQVKRMFGNQDFTVTALHRSHFGPYSLDALEEGRWIDLPPIT